MNSTLSPNMNLIIPTVGQEPGPLYASDINASLTLIDQHSHSAGSGVPITPNALNISSDLTFQSNNATDLRTARFAPQVAALSLPTDLGCLYEAGVDLYYNDGAGNQIRLTQSGSIVGTAGSITGLPSGTASAAYSAGVFTWQQSTGVGATMDSGSVIIREEVASGKGVTLQAQTALVADYSLTLPLIPSSQKIMTLDNAGNMAAAYVTDNIRITVISNTITLVPGGVTESYIADGAVTTPKLFDAAVTTIKIADGNVTQAKMAANSVGTVQLIDGNVTPAKRSTALASQNTSALITTVQSAGAQISIVKTGRPVFITVFIDTSAGLVGQTGNLTVSTIANLLLGKGGSALKNITAYNPGAGQSFYSWSFMDTSGSTGSTTYGLMTDAGTITCSANTVFRVIGYEL